ncbi:hypothetical protein AZE42_09901 [Rhizopogon vesiculosus]|uniref:Uncharacterized protein n=1 Tax=Rhizopogon vesiculosus TaxID=180088 RepID=A0A1J8Q2L8_9AGAM|nr:hypothetical protein AZE42_09901 [Rhizopogon vesiculosus]
MYHMDAAPLGILHIMQLFLPLHRSPSTSAMNDVSTPRSSESETPEWSTVVSNQGQMSPEHVHQDATYQDHSRIPSQPQPSPLIGLGHNTLHEDVFGPNHPGLGVHHREQSRAPKQPIQEQPNNAIQERMHSPGVERSTSYMASMPLLQSTDTDGWHTFAPARICSKLQ